MIAGGAGMFRYYNAEAFPNGVYGSHTGMTPVCMGTLGAEPNYEVRPRILRDYYLVYLLRGRGTLRTEGRTFPLRAGDLYLLYPDVIHAYWTDPEDLIEMYWIGFHGADVPLLTGEAGFRPAAPVFHGGGNGAIEDIVGQMIRDSTGSRPANFWALCGGLYRLFGELIGAGTPNEPWKAQGRALSAVVNEAQNFINIHYPQPISIADVAAHLGVSRATLSARFRAELGKTPWEYVTYVRLRQAGNLLRHTDYTIGEVAHSAGYPDPLYFSKVFSKEYGISPSAYRGKHRGR